MAELLVPIAISSQLDVTGEERIHAAPYKQVVRATYVASPMIGRFVAVGEDGNVATSTDGKAWSLVPGSPFGASSLLRVGLCNGHWVTSCPSTRIVYVSDDDTAQSWQSHSLPVGALSFNFLPPVYAFGNYYLGITSDYVYKSADLSTWTKEATGSSNTGSLTSALSFDFGTPAFLFANYDGGFISSSDGSAFSDAGSAMSIGSDLQKIILATNEADGFVAVGSDFSDTNGVVYGSALENVGFTTDNFVTVAAGNGIYIIGKTTLLYKATTPAGPWTAITFPFGSHFIKDITYGLGVWVATSVYGEMAWSDDDGTTWNAITSPFTESYSVNSIFFSGDAT
jgi:hypothetical protein